MAFTSYLLSSFCIPLSSPDGDMRVVELECRVAAEESAMLNLLQQQAQLLTRMELTLADQQVALAKVRSRAIHTTTLRLFFPVASKL